jgi:hypothetical protein
MPTIDLPLDNRGRAMLPVELTVPAARVRALHQAGLPVPPPLRVSALLDTGASRTCIDPQVRRTLGLVAYSSAAISTPSSRGAAAAQQPLYKVNLTALHPSGNPQLNLARNAFTVAGLPLAHLGTDMVIGRDLLAVCRFEYHGRGGRFSLEY